MSRYSAKIMTLCIKFSIFLALIGCIVLLSIVFDLEKKVTPQSLKAFIEPLGFWGPLVYVGIYCAAGIVLFPAVVLTTTSGVLWGPYLGTLYTAVGASISASIAFLIARVLGRNVVQNLIEKNETVFRVINSLAGTDL